MQLIEEILPLNYYNEMCGIIVDTEIINSIIRALIKPLGPIFDEKDEHSGNFIGNSFINRGLTNLFSGGLIDKELCLLIWDYLFLEGSSVLIRSYYAIYKNIYKLIIQANKNITIYNDIINTDVKKIKKDDINFKYNLFINNKINKALQDINGWRYRLSLEVEKSVDNNNIEFIKSKLKVSYSKMKRKEIKCNEKWPYCINDDYFIYVNKIINNIVLSEPRHKYIDNYFFDFTDNKEKNINNETNNKKSDEDEIYNLLIERRPHFCMLLQGTNNENNENKENKENEVKDDKTKKEVDNKNNEEHKNDEDVKNNDSDKIEELNKVEDKKEDEDSKEKMKIVNNIVNEPGFLREKKRFEKSFVIIENENSNDEDEDDYI